MFEYYEYFNEFIAKKITLKIVTSRNKTIKVIALYYCSGMLYYKFPNSNNSSKISFSNIKSVEFADHNYEISFRMQKLNLPFNIDKYLSYYKNCVSELESSSNYDFREKMFKQMFDSLYMQSSTNLLVRYLKNQKEKRTVDLNRNIFLLSNSNLSQRIAIKNALSQDVSIIQGPPGTGKTTTILSLIANFIMNGKNVVVVSKNNSAVDNIIEEFEKTSLPEFFLRFGRNEDYMKPLQKEISTKLNNLRENISKISNLGNDFNRLKFLQDRLQNLEGEIDELISIKNLIVDLKKQKKFMDKEQELYQFRELLTDDEMKIISEKNVSKKKLARVFSYSKKHKFNFFQRLIIRYYYCINDGDVNQKFYAIYQLLKEVYLKKEIADKEAFLLKRRLEEKQKEVKRIYEEYIEICMSIFKSYLKEKMTLGLASVHSDDLLELAFNVYPLILTTADAFLSNFKDIIKSNEKIDVVIIDEASQCDVITGLPLLYTAKKLVVVGDEKQLSAITNLEVKTDIPYEYRYDNNTFLNSIKYVFEPLEKTLEEHYQCDYNIINYCNKFYYDSQLKIYTDSISCSIEIVDADKYKGAESKNGSFYNDRECLTVEGLVDKGDDYFVITPFKAQGIELKKRFDDKRAGTIHTFQGKGAKKVYFSTVLNDLSFCNRHIKGSHNLFTSELVNVAVSRAKSKFVLITDRKYFQKNRVFVREINNLIDYIKIYGEKIDDDTSCWYDYLYKNIPYYKRNNLYDNEYEEVTHQSINAILKGTPYICCAKIFLTELVLNEEFLNNNPIIRDYIRNGAHADFSIFDNRTGRLKVVVELDGKNHNKTSQKIKDSYKDIAFSAISIPVIRIKAKDAINDKIFIKQLEKYIYIDK